MEGPGVAILLSGASSAGKTSLGQALQSGLERLAVFVPADDLEIPRPSKALDGRRTSELLGVQDRLESLYQAMLVTIASHGFHAIGEMFIWSSEQLARCRADLAAVRHVIVLVTAPAEVLETRERMRGDRHIGTAAGHLQRHPIIDGFDLTVDTARLSTESAAELVINRVRRIEEGSAPGR